MNVVLISNTYVPHVGGVARSVEAFRQEYEALGHRVLVVAPEFPGREEDEADVVRVAALQNFNASDFSVALPVPKGLRSTLEGFEPDIIHAQHPFLLGMTAVRLARTLNLPLVFTHHTLYERYTHYVPGKSEVLQSFIIELATRYGNLADLVFAPSESIRDLLVERGVETKVEVLPTGVDRERFASGDGRALRQHFAIGEDAFVVGHLGRLAEEKNIGFLAESVARFVSEDSDRYFLVVGGGDAEAELRGAFERRGLSERLLCPGVLEGQALVDALAAMDVFAFASTSETQGMVLTEAMAAGLPVIALDAPGVREVVRDGFNGRLLPDPSEAVFHDALAALADLDDAGFAKLRAGAEDTAESYSMRRCAETAIRSYRELSRRSEADREAGDRLWDQMRSRIGAELDIIRSINAASGEALTEL